MIFIGRNQRDPAVSAVFAIQLPQNTDQAHWRRFARSRLAVAPQLRSKANTFTISVRHHLTGLTREELPEYLTHRLRLAACELALFEPPAVEALFQATQGMPRKVNRLAHYALTSAAIDQARTVSIDHVQTAREEVAP